MVDTDGLRLTRQVTASTYPSEMTGVHATKALPPCASTSCTSTSVSSRTCVVDARTGWNEEEVRKQRADGGTEGRTDLVVAGVGVGPGASDRHDRLLKVRVRPPWCVLWVVVVVDCAFQSGGWLSREGESSPVGHVWIERRGQGWGDRRWQSIKRGPENRSIDCMHAVALALTRGPEVGPREAHLDVRPGLVRRLAAVPWGGQVG